MDIKTNGGVSDDRFAFRVGGNTPRTVGSATLVNGQVVIGDVGTVAEVGDFFRATEGPLQFLEIPITSVATNSFTIATTILPLVNDDFYIMRRVTQLTDDTGSQIVTVNQGPIQFVLDNVDTEVEEDTVVPANSIPLPVKVLNAAGLIPDFATETTLAALNAKVVTVDTDDVTVTSSVLPTGAATEATLSTLNGKVIKADTDDVTITSSVLPTGAATEVTLALLNGKVVNVDTDDVTISQPLPAGTNNIGDVDIASALPAGTNNIGDVDIASSLPAGTNIIGQVSIDQTTPGTTNLVSAAQNGTWTVQPGNTANTTPWLVEFDKAPNSTSTTVTLAGAPVIDTLANANASRLGLSLYNSGTTAVTVYLDGSGQFAFIIQPGGYYELPGPYVFTGSIEGTGLAGVTVQVTELS